MALASVLPTVPALGELPGYGTGAHVVTEAGEVPVDWLATGERVMTRDHGFQPVLWIGRTAADAAPAFDPVGLSAGALDGRAPGHETWLTPGTRLPMTGWEIELHTGEAEGLGPASALPWQADKAAAPKPVRFTYVLLPCHGLVLVNGFWAETVLLETVAMSVLSGAIPAALLRRPDVRAGHRHAAGRLLADWELCAMGWRAPGRTPGRRAEKVA